MSIAEYLKTNFGSQAICSSQFDFIKGSNQLVIQRQIRQLSEQGRFDFASDLEFLSNLAARASSDPLAQENGLDKHAFVGFNALFSKFVTNKLEEQEKKPTLFTTGLKGIQNLTGARTSTKDLLERITALRSTLTTDRRSTIVPVQGQEMVGREINGPGGELANNRKLEAVAASLDQEIEAINLQLSSKVDEAQLNKVIVELKTVKTTHNTIPPAEWLEHKPFIAFFMKCEKLKKEFSKPLFSGLRIMQEIEEIESVIRECRSSAADLKSFAHNLLIHVVPFLKDGKKAEQLKRELSSLANGKADSKLTVQYFVSNVINVWLEEKIAVSIERLKAYKINPSGENLDLLKAKLQNLKSNKERLEKYLNEKKLHDAQEHKILTDLHVEKIIKCTKYFDQILEMLAMIPAIPELEEIKDTALSIMLAMDTPYFNENAKEFAPKQQMIVNLAIPLLNIVKIAGEDASFDFPSFAESIDLKFFEVENDLDMEKTTLFEDLYAEFTQKRNSYVALASELNALKVHFNPLQLQDPANKLYVINLYVQYLTAVVSILNYEAKINIKYSQALSKEIEGDINPLKKRLADLPPPTNPDLDVPPVLVPPAPPLVQPVNAKQVWDKNYAPALGSPAIYLQSILEGMEKSKPEQKRFYFQQMNHSSSVEPLKNLVFGNFYWMMRADKEIPESPGMVEFADIKRSWGEGAFLNETFVVPGVDMLQYRIKAMDLAMRGIALDSANCSNYRTL